MLLLSSLRTGSTGTVFVVHFWQTSQLFCSLQWRNKQLTKSGNY